MIYQTDQGMIQIIKETAATTAPPRQDDVGVQSVLEGGQDRHIDQSRDRRRHSSSLEVRVHQRERRKR